MSNAGKMAKQGNNAFARLWEDARSNSELKTILLSKDATRFTTSEVARALLHENQSLGLSIDAHGMDHFETTLLSVAQATLLSVNGIQFAIVNIAAPAPVGAFDKATRPNALWPTAPTDIAGHRAHIFVVASAPKSETREQLLERATLLTLVSAAIASIAPVIGVYWPMSENLISGRMFSAAAHAVTAEARKPVETWVRLLLTPSPGGPQRLMAVTRGLQPYVGREIEFDPGAVPIDWLITRTLQSASYLVETGSAFSDGDTVSAADEQRLVVHLVDQGCLGEGPVYRISQARASEI